MAKRKASKRTNVTVVTAHNPADLLADLDPASQAVDVVFTVPEAAQVCKVSPQTIIRCCESGELMSTADWSAQGGSWIRHTDLCGFMEAHGIPTATIQ